MNLLPDEGRTARIQKYKDERRKQLTARTATLFSANVTQRRPKKDLGVTPAEDSGDFKSSSEININTASTSVPIRTTRTSRLRAAAANHTDASLSPKKSLISASVQSLVDDSNSKTIKNSSKPEKFKSTTIRRQSSRKENCKITPEKCVSEKEIGASRLKPKHSIEKNILEKSNKIVSLRSKDNKINKNAHSDLAKTNKEFETITDIAEDVVNKKNNCDKGISSNLKKENLYNNLVDINAHNNVKDVKGDGILENLKELKGDLNENVNIPVINEIEADKELDNIVKDCVVPNDRKEDTGGLLGAVCVRKVERFSELLSNLCSPYEADLLFEDILAENGIDDGLAKSSSPECSAPCRRAQPSPRATSSLVTTRAQPPLVAGDATGSTTKTRSRRSIEASPLKTEGSLPSSKISPRTNVNTSPLNKSSTQKTTSPISKTNERRRSTEITSTKPSFIPLSKKAADKQNVVSPKQHSSKEPVPKFDTKSKLVSSKTKIQKGQDKSKSDSENITNEKYHNTKKRLISLEKNSLKDSNAANNSKNTLTKRGRSSTVDVASTNNDNSVKMSTLHETVRPHTSRLSQEMDSLAALTKQTLDRVNKLSNNLNSTNKINLDVSEPRYDTLLVSTEKNGNSNTINYGLTNGNVIQPRGVTERLRDIDTAAQRLLDFEKQSAMFSDLSNDTSSQNRRQDNTSTSYSHTPVSILKRKSIHEDNAVSTTPNHAIASPPVTFSPSVLEPRHCRSENRQRQGILKKRCSLDESQVVQRRSCSPEVSFADDSSSDISKPILKNRRSSLEDVIRNRSPDGQIQGILKRKISKEEEHFNDDLSHGSPEPHGILKRKSNSSSSSSTTSSHVSIAQAVLLAAAGGAELVEEDKEIVRPILKKKSFSEERPCLDILPSDTPKPILKKKSVEHEDHDFDLPKKPILKTSKRLSSDEGHTSSFDLSGEDDRSSRRSSLLRSRASDHSGSECEATVRPILKQRGSSLTRERSQSPRPRLSFCADNDADISVTNFSSDANDLSTVGLRRVLNLAHDPEDSAKSQYPSAVLRRRNLRPRDNLRSKSLACDVNDELLSILNNRRSKVEDNCETINPVLWEASPQEEPQDESESKTFPSIAARIKSMEQALTAESSSNQKSSSSRAKNRDRERYKTQPITVEEMRSVASSLEPGQEGFQAFGNAGCSFPRRPVESGAAETNRDPAAGEPETDLFGELVKIDSPPFGVSFFGAKSPTTPNSLSDVACAKDDSIGEATFLDLENIIDNCDRRQSTLDEIEQEVNKVRVALDEDSRALEEDDRQQAEADNWSLNVSCDSGVYNRASSRDSGPHSGEELGLIESQDIKENHAANSSNEWSSSSIERGLLTMDRERKSTENEGLVSPKDQESDDDDKMDNSGFALGLVKSNSVVARASMWQQLQQKAKGTPKPLVRHSRQKAKDAQSVADRFKSQDISMSPNETADQPQNQNFSLAQSKSAANMLDRDEDAKLDEDDPAKMSMTEKMRMFNSKLTHKPPVAGLPRPKEVGRACRRTMPVLASQVQEAMDQNERLTQSLTNDDVPRNPGFKLKMELFRSASAKNTSLEYLMRQNAKFRSLDLDDDSPSERAQRMITPEVRGILKSGSTIVPSKPKTLAKGESSEGLKDEGIDSSSEEESASASSVSSSEKSCSSSDSSDEMPGPKPRRFHRKNKLKSSRTDSDLTRVIQDQFPRKIQLPGAIELKERINQAQNPDVKIPVLGKLGKKIEEKKDTDDRYRKFTKKLDEPIQLGKLRRPAEKILTPTIENPTTVLKISALNQEAKNKFFGIDTQPKKEKNIDEITAAVRKYIPPVVSKSVSTHALEAVAGASGSDGESSGGREVRRINTRGRHRVGSGVQRSATHSDMPHRGGTIAERLAALQAAGANDWRARVCRLSPDREDTKAIERAKNMINDTLNSAVDEKKKVNINENELSSNILADRRNKLETAAQGWRKRVPQTDASQFTVAGRLERDNATCALQPVLSAPAPLTPAPLTPASPGVPVANKFRSRKQVSPTNGFAAGPLRSASCAVVGGDAKAKQPPRAERDAFKRSLSVSDSISNIDDAEEVSGSERSGVAVQVPRADDETFQAFYTPVLRPQLSEPSDQPEHPDLDLDAIDSASRQLLSSECVGRARARRVERRGAARNPLRALAARTDLRDEYCAAPPAAAAAARSLLIKEKVTANCGLAVEALAGLASREDFASVALRSAGAAPPAAAPLLLQVKGRRRVQTRLVEPVHTSVNRGDCFILVTSDQVFLYIGLYANVIERNRSADIALNIHNTKDLGCKNSTGIIKIDETTKNYSNKHWNQFWRLLGLTEDVEEYKPVEAGHPDEDDIFESCIIQTNMCYEVIDDELVPIQEYWGQLPKIAMLNQSKVIVFDFGSELYTWYGKNVPLESRRRAAQLAQELFDDGYNYEECHINPLNSALYQGARKDADQPSKTAKTRPEWAMLSKVTQHMESILFKEKFIDWPDYSRVIKVKPQEMKSSSIEITPCDAEEMWSNEYQDPDLVLEGSHIGRGSHYYDKENMRHYDIKTKSVCKWVIREYDYLKVEDEAEIGEFFSGDSYIIRWEYQITVSGRELNGKPSKHNVTGRDRCAYFCWQGKDASSNEKGAAALLTVELDREKGPQVRVAQGNEPPAFLNLFQGNLIIHQGKRDSDKSRFKLFVTRGNLSNEAYLLQVPCSVRQLRSRGSLLLVDTEKGYLYIWHGARSMKHTKNVAIELANKLIARKSGYLFGVKVADIKINEVKEGEEGKEVLDALGVANKQYYNSMLMPNNDVPDVTPRLFHFTDLSGQFEANEVLSPLRCEHLVTPFPFEQKELYSASQPALFLLDDGNTVWVWQGWWPRGEDGELEPAEINAGVGAFAMRWQALRAAALRSADAYWSRARAAPPPARPRVLVVVAGLEPKPFTDLFDTWQERDDAAEANIAHGYVSGGALEGRREVARLSGARAELPLCALQRRPLPDHVDAHHLERHLADHDFAEAFGMTKEQFAALPSWKQTNLKKDIGLF